MLWFIYYLGFYLNSFVSFVSFLKMVLVGEKLKVKWNFSLVYWVVNYILDVKSC